MKKVIIILVAILFTSIAHGKEYLPFAGSTKHKTVKTMSKKQVKNVKKGKTFYYRKHGKVVKRRKI